MDQLTVYEPQQIDKVIKLVDAVDTWKRDLISRVQAQEISADTAKGYMTGVKKFLEWLNANGDNPNTETIRRWKADLLRVNRPASVNAWLAGIRSFFTWLAEKGEIPFNPTQAIKGATRKGTRKHRREQLTNEEAKAVLTQQDRTTPEGKRNHAMLALMLFTAARTIELFHANVEDLRTESGRRVLYVQGKGHQEKDEILVINAQAEPAMMDWLSERGTHPGPLFTSLSDRSNGGRLSRRAIRKIVKDTFNAAGIQGNKTTHSLRHTAITAAIRAGGDPLKVKAMSRHADINTLMIYYHEADRTDHPAEDLIKYE